MIRRIRRYVLLRPYLNHSIILYLFQYSIKRTEVLIKDQLYLIWPGDAMNHDLHIWSLCSEILGNYMVMNNCVTKVDRQWYRSSPWREACIFSSALCYCTAELLSSRGRPSVTPVFSETIKQINAKFGEIIPVQLIYPRPPLFFFFFFFFFSFSLTWDYMGVKL